MGSSVLKRRRKLLSRDKQNFTDEEAVGASRQTHKDATRRCFVSIREQTSRSRFTEVIRVFKVFEQVDISYRINANMFEKHLSATRLLRVLQTERL